MITVLESPHEASRWCGRQRENNQSLGYVATMGALHQGHQSLISQSILENEQTFASIFVNPLQFNNPHDLEKYPKNLASDIHILEQSGCNMVFTGTLEQFFPDAEDINRIKAVDPGPAGKGLEGEFRPGHLEGVATIVNQLFKTTGSCKAYFGEKDFQQTRVIQDMVRDLDLPLRIEMCPIIREADGMAMSSRNRYLSAEQRDRSLSLHRALQHARQLVAQGHSNGPALCEAMRATLLAGGVTEIDYAALVDPKTLQAVDAVADDSVALIAAHVGNTRLIDNSRMGG